MPTAELTSTPGEEFLEIIANLEGEGLLPPVHAKLDPISDDPRPVEEREPDEEDTEEVEEIDWP